MKLTVSKSANSVTYYVSESYRKPNGVSSTRTFKRLGSEVELREQLGPDVDIKEWAKEQVRKITNDLKKNKPVSVSINVTPDVRLEKNSGNRFFNVGNVFLRRELENLGISKLCKEISSRYKFEYNFEQIFTDLICTRILEPSSKLSSYEYAKKHFLQKPEYQLEDVYKALDVIAKEDDFIQEFFFKASDADVKRNTDVLFYDCTNFFFESSDSGDLRRYGHSKENRPNPIVQMGLFMDGNGIPLGYSIFPGNQNEQISLKPLEQRIVNDFSLKGARMIICTDAGLASTANRRFNSYGKKDFITISPIKKMSNADIEWCLAKGRSFVTEPIGPNENTNLVLTKLNNEGWRVAGGPDDVYISLADIDESDPSNFNKIFYKEKYLVKDGFEQRLIVTYSIKYKRFLEHKRENDIDRASKLINSHNSKKIDIKGNHDIRRFIKSTQTDSNGNKVDTKSKYELDDSAILNDAKFDGFYAVCTSLDKDEKSVEDIIAINKGRWEIEESFRIMKTEFKARPVFVSTDEHIKAHFNTCFTALLVFRLLEQKLLKNSEQHFTVSQIVDTLRTMNITKVGNYYTSSFERTDLTDQFHEISKLDVFFDCEYISSKTIRTAYKKYLK